MKPDEPGRENASKHEGSFKAGRPSDRSMKDGVQCGARQPETTMSARMIASVNQSRTVDIA